MKDLIAFIAVLLPVAACALTGWRFFKQDKGSWQLAACFAALVIATSIVLLAASDKISFVRYGEAVVQVNQKLEETRQLTEQNKRMARATAELVIGTADYIIGLNSNDYQRISERVSVLLREAKMSDDEIQKYLQGLNKGNFRTTNSP